MGYIERGIKDIHLRLVLGLCVKLPSTEVLQATNLCIKIYMYICTYNFSVQYNKLRK